MFKNPLGADCVVGCFNQKIIFSVDKKMPFRKASQVFLKWPVTFWDSCTEFLMWKRKAGYQNWDLFMKLERSRREDFEDTLKLYILFQGLLLEGSNTTKWDDYQKKKLFINNAMETLILFNEDDQGLLRLHIPLGGVTL